MMLVRHGFHGTYLNRIRTTNLRIKRDMYLAAKVVICRRFTHIKCHVLIFSRFLQLERAAAVKTTQLKTNEFSHKYTVERTLASLIVLLHTYSQKYLLYYMIDIRIFWLCQLQTFLIS